jgi:hypothetical protein
MNLLKLFGGFTFLDHKHNEKVCKQFSVANIIDHRNRRHEHVFRMDPLYISHSTAL